VKKLFTYYGDSGLDSYDKGDFYGISLWDIRNNKRDVSLFLVSKIWSEFAENEEFIKNNWALQEALIKSINIISEYLKAEGVSLEDSLTIKNLTAKSMPYWHNQTRDNPFFQPFQDFVTSQIG
jgi:hypothetical protein